MTNRADNTPRTPTNHQSSRWEGLAKAWSVAQFYIAVTLTAGFALYLFLFPHGLRQHAEEPPRSKPVEVVQTVGSRMIQIRKGSGLEEKLELASVREERITSPLFTVTGTVVASLRPGGRTGTDYWQFNSPEVLTTFTDWQKATADVTFAESQLKSVQDLADTRAASQRKVVDQMDKLVQSGTESQKTLNAERTTLTQYEIQGKKEVYEAETTVRTARRQETALSKQLQQSGIDPALLQSAKADLDIIVADVPEAFLSRVRVDQECEAKFLSLSDQIFRGVVKSILPMLSKERRTLRLLFVINDPADQLRPGMFAEIGLGTDPRKALLAPAEGILHVGRTDYALVGTVEEGKWKITEVDVGEPQGGQVEILHGVEAGDRLIGKGAILLKPVVIRSLQNEADDSNGPRLSRAEAQ
jgi:hypothetical protein